MDLSVLLISYNTKKLTLAALESIIKDLKNVTFKYEILVLDNHSSDGSVEIIRSHFKGRVKLFSLKENLGFGRGNNYLTKQARGWYLLLLNSDTEVQKGGIVKLLNFFQHQSQFDFVGGKLLNSDGTDQPSCGPLYTPLVAVGALFLRGDYWGLTRFSPNRIKKVGWVSGACVLTTKDNYEKLGGFDENVFMYMEEIDLFKRAQDAGMTVGFYPEARILHHGFASSGGRSRPVINVFKGYLYYYAKHYGRFTQAFLRLLLKTKALAGYTLGVLVKNHYLKETYDEALKVLR